MYLASLNKHQLGSSLGLFQLARKYLRGWGFVVFERFLSKVNPKMMPIFLIVERLEALKDLFETQACFFPRVPPQGAAAGCCLKVLLSEWCVRFGAGLLVPLQPLQGAAAECCFRVLLPERYVRFGGGLLVLLQGSAAGCCC